MKIIFWVSAFAIFYPMIGYPLTLLLLDKIIKRKKYKRLHIQAQGFGYHISL